VIWMKRFVVLVVATALIAGCGGQASKENSTPVAARPASTAGSLSSSIVANGPVAFSVCGEIRGYRKLTPAEMQSVFTNKRFGDGTKLEPAYWAIYRSDYYWIQEPHAVSGNVENAALGAGTTIASGPAPSSQVPACRPPDDRQNEAYQALWLYDHQVVAMRADSGILTVEVESKPGNWENVEFPDPAAARSLPPAKSDPVPFTALRIVDASGRLLSSRGVGGNSWEFDDQGGLVAGTVSSGGAPVELDLPLPIDVELVCEELPRGAANVTFAPSNGVGFTIQATACANAWQVAVSAHLDPGHWTIRADGDEYYTVLPKGGLRP